MNNDLKISFWLEGKSDLGSPQKYSIIMQRLPWRWQLFLPVCAYSFVTLDSIPLGSGLGKTKDNKVGSKVISMSISQFSKKKWRILLQRVQIRHHPFTWTQESNSFDSPYFAWCWRQKAPKSHSYFLHNRKQPFFARKSWPLLGV